MRANFTNQQLVRPQGAGHDIKPVMSEFLPRQAVRQPEWSHELMMQYWARR